MKKKITVSIEISDAENNCLFRTITEEKIDESEEREEEVLAQLIWRSLRRETLGYDDFSFENFLSVLLLKSEFQAFSNLGILWNDFGDLEFDEFVRVIKK